MASRSSNRTAVPEAKAALDKFKYEVASELGSTFERRIQWRLNIQTERICWWLYGEKNDRAAGKTNVREIVDRCD